MRRYGTIIRKVVVAFLIALTLVASRAPAVHAFSGPTSGEPMTVNSPGDERGDRGSCQCAGD